MTKSESARANALAVRAEALEDVVEILDESLGYHLDMCDSDWEDLEILEIRTEVGILRALNRTIVLQNDLKDELNDMVEDEFNRTLDRLAMEKFDLQDEISSLEIQIGSLQAKLSTVEEAQVAPPARFETGDEVHDRITGMFGTVEDTYPDGISAVCSVVTSGGEVLYIPQEDLDLIDAPGGPSFDVLTDVNPLREDEDVDLVRRWVDTWDDFGADASEIRGVDLDDVEFEDEDDVIEAVDPYDEPVDEELSAWMAAREAGESVLEEGAESDETPRSTEVTVLDQEKIELERAGTPVIDRADDWNDFMDWGW